MKNMKPCFSTSVEPSLLAVKVACRLAVNGLRYRVLRYFGLPGRPQALSLELTRACVCRCVMCNIWKTRAPRPELSLDEWANLLADPMLSDLRELDLTGGEPFLRHDLVALVEKVCELKRRDLKRLRSIAVTTNAVLTQRVLEQVNHMLSPLAQAGLELVVVCALDAVGELHDRIRRYFGAWECLEQTLEGLTALRHEHQNLVLGIKTTVLPENVRELPAIVRYARERDLFAIISPAIATPGRYVNAELARRLSLGPAAREEAAIFYEAADLRWSYHAQALARYLRGGPMIKPCTCGFNYLFVRADGMVFFCPLSEESRGAVGNVREAPLGVLLSSQRARTLRRHIGRSPCCASCTEPGLERYSLPYEGWAYLHTLATDGLESFLEHYRHLGLDKYL